MKLTPAAGIALAALLASCGGGEEAAAPADARPDLQILSVRMDLMAIPASKIVAEVRNAGGSTAQGFDCRCHWSCPGVSLYNTELRIMEGAVLAAGATQSFSIEAPPHSFGCAGPPPVLDVNCVVDDRGAVDEFDENNNRWGGSVRLAY
jgi:hypothetical protein